MKTLWYYSLRIIVKAALFFFLKKITVNGKKNIPKKGAVLFAVNHPNALIDPLLVATTNRRMQHFLVRAAVFKNPVIKKLLATLNLMPIYRIRDGVKELAKNEHIFNTCFSILKKGQTLMIFPEGTHNIKRTVRPVSKGFTRIAFGTIDRFPNVRITIIPVGITYQNASLYPTSVTVSYGNPIIANDHYDVNDLQASIMNLRTQVSNQLKEITVHIPDDENYPATLKTLDTANVNYTEVATVNKMIASQKIIYRKKRYHPLLPLKLLIVLNSIIPWLFWKKVLKRIDETEFIDTFRFGVNAITFPLFYLIQSWVIAGFFGWKTAIIYFLVSVMSVLVYTKFETIPPGWTPE